MNQFTTTEYVNICLVECVIACELTILDTYFSQDFAQCKIKHIAKFKKLKLNINVYKIYI